jgi:hypothetical protein
MPRKRLSLEVQPVQKAWLSKREAMKYLDKSDKFLKKLRDEGQVEYSEYGNAIWYPLKSIDRFLERNKA